MIRKYIAVLIFIFLILSSQCSKESSLDFKCYLNPESGPCRAYFPKYYYDEEEGKCKKFIWGGCEGVVLLKHWKNVKMIVDVMIEFNFNKSC
jgi:thiol-disulfide isomerase/thioredoxin